MITIADRSRRKKGDAALTIVPPLPDTSGNFTTFYEGELAGQVRRATLLVGDCNDARDLVHDAFVEVYRRWDDLDAPGAYLNTVVLNRCRDRARRVARQNRVVVETPQVAVEELDDEALWTALQQLPFNHRAALVLRFHHQMTTAEIAAALGCQPGSVGPWIERGLRQLRKDLA